MSDFWIGQPKNLWRFKFDNIANIFNSISLIIIILTIIICLAIQSIKPFYVTVVIIAILGIVYYLFLDNGEPFKMVPPSYNLLNYPQQPLRRPSPPNPFMNVPIRDYDAPQKKSDYHRYDTKAYPTPHTEETRTMVENDFEKNLFQDANGRLFDRQNSQRQYISQPVGSVPNKQTEMAQWLYGNTDEALCKQGSIWDRYGLKSVPNSCNGFNISTPTGFGIKQMN